MKRIFLLLSVLLPGLLLAENISEEQARRVATAFWQSSPQTRGTSAVSWQLVMQSENLATRSAGMEPAYYVYNNASGTGFVIVAGDDVAMPVLGYSFENEFPGADRLPANVQGWLNGLRDEINAARRDGLEPSPAAARAWATTSSGTPVVELETAQWDQGSPYNDLCPKINGVPTYTGCTATAMAIAMRYHQWPVRGEGAIGGYAIEGYGGWVAPLVLGHEYDWGSMPLVYTFPSPAQSEAVATLMRDCAIALESSFGPEGSSGTGALITNMPPALIGNFGYSKTTRYVIRESYSTAEWNTLMQAELDANRPIVYSGYNPDSGHAFVLDGYTTESYFRVNWGWSGYCNGYYMLSALEPTDTGIGGGLGEYNDSQIAIIGIQKDDGSEGVEELRFSYFDNRTGQIQGADRRIYNGFAVDNEVIRQNEEFVVHLGFVYNSGSLTVDGVILLAMADKDGRIVEELAASYTGTLEAGYGFVWDCPVTITQPILPGYRIRAYYSSERTPDWTVIRGNEEDGCVWELLLAGESAYTIEESTSFTYNKTEQVIRLTVQEGVSATLQDDRQTDYSDACNASGTEITIDASRLPAGSYTLTLQRDSEQKVLRFFLGEGR